MEIAIIEILLWLGFGLLLWALRESLNSVEVELTAAPPVRRRTPLPPPSNPQTRVGPIGRYADSPIHEFAIIEGRTYRFECVCPRRDSNRLACHQRWVPPGLVYAECALPSLQPGSQEQRTGARSASRRQQPAEELAIDRH